MKSDNVSTGIDQGMKLKDKKETHRCFALSNQVLKDSMPFLSSIMTYSQRRCINEQELGNLTSEALKEMNQRNKRAFDQAYKVGVMGETWKQITAPGAEIEIKVTPAFVIKIKKEKIVLQNISFP